MFTLKKKFCACLSFKHLSMYCFLALFIGQAYCQVCLPDRKLLLDDLSPYSRTRLEFLLDHEAHGQNHVYPNTKAWNLYRAYYDVCDQALHYSFSIDAVDMDVVLQVFRPRLHAEPEHTVFFIHGYLDHVGINMPLIQQFLNWGFQVLVMDMPGHGLSQGDRNDISDFRIYADALIAASNWMAAELEGHFHFLAHSTGAAAMIEALLNSEEGDRSWEVYVSYTFLAPLVRSYLWNLSISGMSLFGWVFHVFSDGYLPSRSSGSTSDPVVRKIKKTDPLVLPKVPLTWVEALWRWDERNQDYSPRDDIHIHVFQGTGDTVVSWQYNLEYIQSKFVNTTYTLFSDFYHGMQYERKDRQREFFQELKMHYLELLFFLKDA